jgi:RNA-directed DNA polymerase
LGDLTCPEAKVQNLQTALHAKAKAEPKFRFYQLYDKVYLQDVLAIAYQRCKSNGGVAGVDGQTFKDIAAYGEEGSYVDAMGRPASVAVSAPVMNERSAP